MKSTFKNFVIILITSKVMVLLLLLLTSCDVSRQKMPADSSQIIFDYPLEGAVFPPEFPAPAFLWNDTNKNVNFWKIIISFSDQTPEFQVTTTGAPLPPPEIDQRCVTPTNQLPEISLQKAARSWIPDSSMWSTIKKHSINHPAKIVISGHRRATTRTVVSQGEVSITTSKDSVGAPIFYRDVPLMPSTSEKGVIRPLALQSFPLISWKLRNVARNKSRVLMEGLHTCANCHSFSADGSTLGMDMDGPQNDKGLYAIVKIKPQMKINNEHLVKWSTFRGKLGSKLRVGFMSQISPDAKYVITTINDPGIDQSDYLRRKNPIDLARNYYVANFKDYRFLQVFYPTRGVLAWYSPQTKHLQCLPGADDTNYVHTNAVWSPDAKYLVFARAKASDAYPYDAQEAQYANDPNETCIQYDLYRIPFNNGKGGKAEPIIGASNNGMSNSFPRISPDGRWIVFVQARNGLLMRPDSKLYIVPANGGAVRRMECNTPLMNSWHSFSPNGRWMVFSSKSRSPYTQMLLTHIDSSGEDSPPILIENATAANRAINIPEFVNIPPDGIIKIDAPAAEYALHVDLALKSVNEQRFEAAIAEWNTAIKLAPHESRLYNGLGSTLAKMGKPDEAIPYFRKALELDPQYAEVCNNLGDVFARKGCLKEAITQFERAVRLDPEDVTSRTNLGIMLGRIGLPDKAIVHLKKAIELNPDAADTRMALGNALIDNKYFSEATLHLEKARALSNSKNPLILHLLGRAYAGIDRKNDDLLVQQEALSIAAMQNNWQLEQLITVYISNVLQN